MGTTGILDTHTASLYELAFTATSSVPGQSCEVKQRRARLVAGWVTEALLGSCAHAGYHQHYSVMPFLLRLTKKIESYTLYVNLAFTSTLATITHTR